MEVKELRQMPRALDLLRSLSSQADLNDVTRVGSNFERIVAELRGPIADHTAKTIKKLNGSGSPIYEVTDATFLAAVDMVAEDVANALLKHRQGEALSLLDRSAVDVLSQLAHLRLDFGANTV